MPATLKEPGVRGGRYMSWVETARCDARYLYANPPVWWCGEPLEWCWRLFSMLLSKRCPKCGGNLIVGSDYYGRYATCMQCGRAVYLSKDSDDVQEAAEAVAGASRSGRGRPRL